MKFRLTSLSIVIDFKHAPACSFGDAERNGLAMSAGKPLRGLNGAILTEKQQVRVIILIINNKLMNDQKQTRKTNGSLRLAFLPHTARI